MITKTRKDEPANEPAGKQEHEKKQFAAKGAKNAKKEFCYHESAELIRSYFFLDNISV